MKIKEFLNKNKISIEAFSRKCELDSVTLRRIIMGRDFKMSSAAKIVEATKNQITFEDLIPLKKYCPKRQ